MVPKMSMRSSKTLEELEEKKCAISQLPLMVLQLQAVDACVPKMTGKIKEKLILEASSPKGP